MRLTLIMEDVAAKVPVDGDARKVARLKSEYTTSKLDDHHHRHQQSCLNFERNPKTGHCR